jgi:hypothetical protein
LCIDDVDSRGAPLDFTADGRNIYFAVGITVVNAPAKISIGRTNGTENNLPRGTIDPSARGQVD